MTKSRKIKNSLAMVHEEVTLRKQEAVVILRDLFFTDGEIKNLCQLVSNPPPDKTILDLFETEDELKALSAKASALVPAHVKKNLHNIIPCATAALVCYMRLEMNLPPADNKVQVETDTLGDLLLDAMTAAMMLVEASGGPAVPLAESRIMQLRNQPNKRDLEMKERADIEMAFEEYCASKGKPPNSFEIFISFLSGNGYIIDPARGKKGTIDKSGWNRHRSLRTVQNWFDEKKNQYLKNSP